jgi:predicted alpha/beta superfamily hydrolase
MNKYLILILLSISLFIGAEASEKKFLELPKIEVIPIKDTKSNRQYELYIKLPEGYSKNNDIKYPVIYFTDAMWHVEILSGSAEYLVENAILVGISWEKDVGAQVSRVRDYTPTVKKGSKYQTGEAGNHLTFIRNDLIKYVENNYLADPGRRTYFGYSVGGLFGAYILLVQPDTFKNYILGSPETLFDDRYIYELESIVALKRENLSANVFVSVGALERKDMVGHAEGLISMLKRRNSANLSLELAVIKSADHGTAFPVAAVRSMIWLSNLNT